jgi:hypothetical protein
MKMRDEKFYKKIFYPCKENNFNCNLCYGSLNLIGKQNKPQTNLMGRTMKKIGSKLFHFFSYFLFSSLAILIFNFCAEKKPTEPNELQKKLTLSKSGGAGSDLNLSVTSDSTKTKDKDKDKGKKGGGDIGPYAPSQCQKVVQIWQFDHYEAVPEKIVGILPETATWANNTKLRILIDTLGYKYVCTTESYINACLQVGYTAQTIMIGGFNFSTNNYQITMQNYPGFLAYYTDEPVSDQNLSCIGANLRLQQVRDYMNNNGCGSSKLVVGETISDVFGWESYSQCVEGPSDILMCTRYYLWYSSDQRDIWTLWKTDYPSKFNWTWVSSRLDNTEFDDLIGHAVT